MDDSFFGFDTSVPLDDDGGGGRIAEPSEEEYDALNDETFGSAINGDWEEAHETMVRLTDPVSSGDALDSGGRREELQSSNASSPALLPAKGRYLAKYLADSDLELNLSGMKLDDVDLSFDDSESVAGGVVGGLNLDPSVWASNPLKPYNNQANGMEAMKLRHMLYDNMNNGSGHGGSGHDMDPNRGDFLRDAFPHAFHHQQQQQQQQQHHQQQQQRMKQEMGMGGNSNFGFSQLPPAGNPPKICTVEDIERNIIIQQALHKQQQEQQQQQQQQHQQQKQQKQLLSDILKQSPKTPTPLQQQQQQMQKPPQQPLPQPPKGPPGFTGTQTSPPRPTANFANNMAQHPLSNMLPQQSAPGVGNRLPTGALALYPPGLGPHLQQQSGHPHPLPPHPLLNQHGLPPNFPHLHQRPLPSSHLPIALNNFAMHPNFNAMRAAAGIHAATLVPPPQPPRMPPHTPNPAMLLQQQQSNSMYNMFNMRLVQEIQQNHPLLQARQAQQQQQQQQHNAMGLNNHQQHHQQRGGPGGIGMKQGHHRRDGGPANGNLPHDEFDEYANLMSTRDKHWLIGIQLSQLNTDTPYIDDFYYTVYRERKAALSGNMRHSQAHKDNQLNHPLIQPKGHAQLILVQLGNKNGTRNGQHRERRSSESTGGGGGNSAGNAGGNNQEQKTPYVFTPLKFENSLGKLQYGSVTAPRKIIDAEIMNGDAGSAGGDNNSNTSAISGVTTQSKLGAVLASCGGTAIGDVAASAQRKSRHILLHIETLYRIVLKLEDLNNPNAIATIRMKKKKESERIAALEQLENANKTPEERAAEAINPPPMNPALKNKFAYEIEKKEVLIAKLVAGLSHDEVIAIMNVRKGKALMRRIMPYIKNEEIRWNVWIGVFAALQSVVKKDPEDTDGILYALYPEFKEQIRDADFKIIVRISTSIPLSDKKSNGIFCSRFGISSLVCLIIQAEQIYVAGNDKTHNDANKEKWRQFLDQVAVSLNRTIQNQTICAAIESDSIQPMMNHFARFKDLKLDSLLALITEAKQQIN